MLKKFQNITDAILADTNNYAPKNPFMKSMRERLEYLTIEIEGGQTSFANRLFLIVQMSFFLFLKNFKKKLYFKFSNMNN